MNLLWNIVSPCKALHCLRRFRKFPILFKQSFILLFIKWRILPILSQQISSLLVILVYSPKDLEKDIAKEQGNYYQNKLECHIEKAKSSHKGKKAIHDKSVSKFKISLPHNTVVGQSNMQPIDKSQVCLNE